MPVLKAIPQVALAPTVFEISKFKILYLEKVFQGHQVSKICKLHTELISKNIFLLCLKYTT